VFDVQAHLGASDPPESRRLVLELVGGDRPGIVREISSVLAANGVTIDELTTATRGAPMAGGMLFEATAVLGVPVGAGIDQLRAALEAVANELMVDIDMADL
jgi:glycine cleavage system regulatory protein